MNFDNGLSKKDFVKKSSCTTGAAKAVSAETAPTFDKPDFLQNDFVNKNPSGATEVDFLHDSRVNRVLPPEVVEKHLQDAMDAWDT